MPGMSLRIAPVAALCGAILLPAAAAAQAPAPTWARGGIIIRSISFDECMARAVLAAQAQGFRVGNDDAGVVLAKKANHLAIIHCVDTAPSKIVLKIVVAGNGGTGDDALEVVNVLQAEMEKSSCRPTTWGFQHCYGKKTAK